MDGSKAIVAHLTQELGCRVSTERPASPPDRMVTAVRLGGGGSMFRETSRYAIHAWAASEKDAYKLGMEAAEAMFSLPGSAPNVAHVEQDSFYSNIYPDGSPRWTGAYTIISNR